MVKVKELKKMEKKRNYGYKKLKNNNKLHQEQEIH